MCVLGETWEVRYRGEPPGPESSVQEDSGPGAQWLPWALRIHPPCPLADFLLSPQKGHTSIPSEALGHCKGGDEPVTSPATLCPAPNPPPRGRWGLAASWKWEQRKTQRKQDFNELFCPGCASWHQLEKLMGVHILFNTSSCLFHLLAKLAASTFRQSSK